MTLKVFALDAILLVDDTYLLMCASTPTTTQNEFIKYVHQALNNWAALVMASGGSLKQSKSFAVVKTFDYSSGKAKLIKTRVLPT